VNDDCTNDQGVSLLYRADQYLLQAKASGRNRVMSGHHHSSHLKVKNKV